MQYTLIDLFRTIKILPSCLFALVIRQIKQNKLEKQMEDQLKSNGIHIVGVNYESVLELKSLRQVFM